jgi:transcriptional regulator with XRE-family HTH domain
MQNKVQNKAQDKTQDKAFGQLLKHWRSHKKFSQLDLSMVSGVSQRHISFIESGRARPSQDMVLKLATVLDIPLRQRNKLLTTAGFAPIYSELDLSAPEVAPIRRALDFTLRQQDPYPALVMDRYWNQVQLNQGAAKLMGWLLTGQTVPDIGPNLMKLMLHPEGARKHIVNWDAIAPHLIHRVHREAQGRDERSQALFDTLLSYPDIRELWQAPLQENWENWQLPLLTVSFAKGGRQLSFFTTLTTLGTPHDITLQELRIECLFPADESSEQQFKSLKN